MSQNETIRALFAERLRESPYWTAKTREGDGMVNYLTCPACGEPEGFAYSDNPFVIFCHRQKRCGVKTFTKALFPDILQSIERRFTPTQANPDRPATEFLRSRGLDKALEGLRYKYSQNIRGTNSGAVMFHVGTAKDGKNVWNGRLFNPPKGQGKTHNDGSTKGLIWTHQGRTYDPAQDVYITEGVINALSLIEMGFQALAVLSSGQSADAVDLTQYGKPVFAFDQDEAGAHATQRWMKAYASRGCGARAILPIKGDWNDHLSAYGSSDYARKKFDEKVRSFEFQARLAQAETAQLYAEIWNAFYGGHSTPGLFRFQGCYYWATAKAAKNEESSNKDKASTPPEVRTIRVSQFTVDVDHFQLNLTNPEEPEHRYFLIVRPRKGKAVRCSVTAADLSAPASMRTLFLLRANVLWEGELKPTLALIEQIVESKAPTVRQLINVGYDPDSNTYVFPTYAVDQTGKSIARDGCGFFPILQDQSLRPAQYITLEPKKGPDLAHIWQLCVDAWGENAAVAIAWTTAVWWVNQIKAHKGFFPFLSLWGDAGTGKSRLARTMNAMQGLDEEGMPMNRVNTAKGEIRKLSQLSGMFKGFLESTEDAGARRFDLDTILPLYNINPLQITALKTNDSQTRELPFRASFLFVQNPNIFKTRPQKERVITLKFVKNKLNEFTFAAFTALTEIPAQEIAYFMPIVLAHRTTIDAQWPAFHEVAKADLRPHVRDNRLVENYAIVLAWHRMIAPIIGVEHDLLPFIARLVSAKWDECENRQDDPAEYFLNTVLNLQGNPGDPPAWQQEGGTLYVHLPEAVKLCQSNGYGIPGSIPVLQDALKKHPAFVKSNHAYRMNRGAFSPEPKKVWVFNLCYLQTCEVT